MNDMGMSAFIISMFFAISITAYFWDKELHEVAVGFFMIFLIIVTALVFADYWDNRRTKEDLK